MIIYSYMVYGNYKVQLETWLRMQANTNMQDIPITH
jgi:hypothetical protein